MSTARESRVAAIADASKLAIPVLTAGAQTSHTKVVTIQIKDQNGDAVPRVQRLNCYFRKSDFLLAVVGEITLAETGVGAEVSTTAKASLLITTDANGAATISITDVGGAGISGYLVAEPLDLAGTPGSLAITLTA